VRPVFEHEREHGPQWRAIGPIRIGKSGLGPKIPENLPAIDSGVLAF
jgi:hypothetical protein